MRRRPGGACATRNITWLRRSAPYPPGALAARLLRLRDGRPRERPEDHQGAEDEHAQPSPQIDVDPGRLVLDVRRAEDPEGDQDQAVEHEHPADDAADVESVGGPG